MVQTVRLTLYANVQGKIVPKAFNLKSGDSLEETTGNPAYARFFIDEILPDERSVTFSVATVESKPVGWHKLWFSVDFIAPTFQDIENFRVDVTRKQIEEYINEGRGWIIPVEIIVQHPDLAETYLLNERSNKTKSAQIIERLLEQGYTPNPDALMRHPGLTELDRKFPGVVKKATDAKHREQVLADLDAGRPVDMADLLRHPDILAERGVA